MMDHNDLTGLYATLGSFSGIALIIWVSVQGKIAHMKAQAKLRQQWTSPPQDSALLAEFQKLKQQMAEMHSTSHQFDLSFDEALNRLEGRVGRLETKTAASTASAPAEATLRNGSSSTP